MALIVPLGVHSFARPELRINALLNLRSSGAAPSGLRYLSSPCYCRKAQNVQECKFTQQENRVVDGWFRTRSNNVQ